jgi:hypothetical protein
LPHLVLPGNRDEGVGWGKSSNPIGRVKTAIDGVHCFHPILRGLVYAAVREPVEIRALLEAPLQESLRAGVPWPEPGN